MPKASIIITTYNRPQILYSRSLPSARKQDFKDYEIIIVDHGSTELYPFDLGKKWIRLDKNSGIVSTARNAGVREAKGEYIVFLDDDNELAPNFLSETIPLLDSSKDMSAVCSGRIVKHDGYEEYARPYRSDHLGHEKFASVDWGWLIRRSVFDTIQYDEKMFFSEDGDFGLQFTEKFAFMSLDKPLQIAYAKDEGVSHSKPNEKMIKALDYYLEKNLKFYKEQNNELRHLYRLMGRRCYMGGHRVKGIKFFWKSFLAMKNWRTLKHFLFILLGWSAYNAFMIREEKKYAK